MSISYSLHKSKIGIQRITALWAFSEAALGGILHTLKIPLTGLFIGSAAVLFITQIAILSETKSQILRSTLLVILVKAVVTPFVPLNSFLAVSIQGLLGYCFFRFIPNKHISALLLGVFALSFSAFQKLIVMTILFGNTLWASIDSFVRFIVSQLPFVNLGLNVSASLIIISVYASLHLLAGIFVGLYSGRFDKWIEKKAGELIQIQIDTGTDTTVFERPKQTKRKKWWQRKSGITFLLLSIILTIISYLFPQLSKFKAIDVVFMLLRVFVISILWFYFLSPLVVRWITKLIDKKKFEHAAEMNNITALFPRFKSVLNYCWSNSSNKKGLDRLKSFFSNSLAYLILSDFENHG